MGDLPKISDERLEELMARIKPVGRFARRITQNSEELVRDSTGDLYFIEDVDPRRTSFNWDSKAANLASGVNPNAYRTIVTLHDYGAPIFFKPLIAEVLAQIPEEELSRVVAFETNHLDFSNRSEYHTANTMLYEAFSKSIKRE